MAGPAVPDAGSVRLAAGDMNGDGLDDLVVIGAGSGQAFVYFQDPHGGFGPAGRPPDLVLPVGVSPSDVALADVNGDGQPDIVVTSQFSGTVSILLNRGHGSLASALRFRAGVGLSDLVPLGDGVALRSAGGPIGLAAAPLERGGSTDLIVTDRTDRRVTLLRGTGSGGFLNPGSSLAIPADRQLTAVVVGSFLRGGPLDLVVLDQSQVEIFTPDNSGVFQQTSIPVGNVPSGLAVADVNGDGLPDLVVGNALGEGPSRLPLKEEVGRQPANRLSSM